MSEGILDRLAQHARERTEAAKRLVPPGQMRELAFAQAQKDRESGREDLRFEKALAKPGISLICECKKASPSKGLIAEEFPFLEIAEEYEAAGADCISVLTEPKWFLGSDRYLREIAEAVEIPCLRKDFTIDPYMIYEAKALGAAAILLICSLLSGQQLAEYREIADELGMSSLTEAHSAEEIETAVRAGARVIGVNNRNLSTFETDVNHAGTLRSLVPPGKLFVAESGIRGAEDVHAMREIGADAVLVGESLMRAQDRRALIARMKA